MTDLDSIAKAIIDSAPEYAGNPNPEKLPGQVYTIPVAFAVRSESEIEAAMYLVRRLADAELVSFEYHNEIESWWTPNHIYADGSDKNDPTLVWENNSAV